MPTNPKFDLTQVPGKVLVKIIPFQADDLGSQTQWDDGSIHPMGISLAELQKQAVNDELEWEEPIHKTKIRIPLKPFLERGDPNNTYLRFVYRFEPDPEFLSQNPGFPDAYEAYLRESGRARVRGSNPSTDQKPNTFTSHSH